MIGNLPGVVWTGFTMLIVCQVAEANLPEGPRDANSLCKLRKTCTTLGNKFMDNESNLQAKQRICQLADQASLLPDETKCEEPGLELGLDEVTSMDDGEDLDKTLCDLSTSCLMLALTPHAQDPDHEPMKTICKLADGKMKAQNDITCKPIEPTKNVFGDEDSESDGGGELLENQDERPQVLTLSRTYYYFDDCSEIYAAQTLYGTPRSGVYTIRPVSSGAFSVYCDMDTDGGGWTVIQTRFDGTIHFNRRFNDYKYGFGSANGEYWLGLQNMYLVTAQNTYELHVELEDWSNNTRYAKYSSFRVGGGDNYQLSLGSYSGNAGDGLTYFNGMKFSAGDRDQDDWSGNCAAVYGGAGGWWYKGCGRTLNGPYFRPSDRTSQVGWGISWGAFSPSTYRYYLKKSKMMIRPADFRTGK
ncbi:ANGPTL1 [Branchiostoma lanceolatum]|uniref:ANGPTL1 protein n=1 Tax=Branchiostoma lanceolatum TaxID=7740 RepID=A0A8J9VE36_BRALA|nr:ANGPTL1 [Branchiostoma lanceolatum]